MTARDTQSTEKVMEATEAVRQAGRELLAYLEQAEEILETREDTLRRQEIIFMRARLNSLNAKWRVTSFDYLAMTGHTAEEIKEILSHKKKKKHT